MAGLRTALLLALLALASPARAQPRLDEAAVRAFVGRQEQAWNAGDLRRYFAGFTPDARFTDQAYNGGKPPVPYGSSTVAQARAQATKAQKSKPHETGRITAVTLGTDGRSAQVSSTVFATLGPRRLCASRVQTLVATSAGVRSKGQTDTYVRCRRG